VNATPALEILSSTPCDQALAIWFDQHKTYIRGATPRTYRQYVKVLAEFFQQTPLQKIALTGCVHSKSGESKHAWRAA